MNQYNYPSTYLSVPGGLQRDHQVFSAAYFVQLPILGHFEIPQPAPFSKRQIVLFSQSKLFNEQATYFDVKEKLRRMSHHKVKSALIKVGCGKPLRM